MSERKEAFKKWLKKHHPVYKAANDHMLAIIKERPLDMNIEGASFCPLGCRFCCNKDYERELEVLPIDHFEHLVKEYYDMGGGALGLGSMQSDFLSDPLLLERVEVLKRYKDRLWIYSTTPLIAAKKYSDEELLSVLSLFSYLEVSVAGQTKELYKEMAGIDAFEVFHEQLIRLHELIGKASLTMYVEVSFRTNDRVALEASDFYKELMAMYQTRTIKDHFFSWFGTITQEMLPKGAILVHQDNSDKKEDCIMPHATLAVEANGKVIGCGCLDWLQRYVIGDTYKESLKEIWTSDKALNFRHCFTKGWMPSICKECGLYMPADFYHKKYNGYKPTDGLYYK